MMKLMAITAHPDDEAGAFGGALLCYHARGVETSVICLTAGQAATHRGPARSDGELAALRRAEFAAACRILHVDHGEVLDYPDGGLVRADLLAVVGDLTERIRTIRPHVILTMGPEGAVTGHPDHSMASLFATLAYQWAGRRDRFPEQLEAGLEPHRTQKLYYSTAAFTLPERPPVSPPPCSATLAIGPWVEEKIAAFRAHATQAPLWEAFARAMRRFGDKELYHLAAVSQPSVAEAESDLLEGVSG